MSEHFLFVSIQSVTDKEKTLGFGFQVPFEGHPWVFFLKYVLLCSPIILEPDVIMLLYSLLCSAGYHAWSEQLISE